MVINIHEVVQKELLKNMYYLTLMKHNLGPGQKKETFYIKTKAAVMPWWQEVEEKRWKDTKVCSFSSLFSCGYTQLFLYSTEIQQYMIYCRWVGSALNPDANVSQNN